MNQWKKEFIHWITLKPETRQISDGYTIVQFNKGDKLHNIDFPASLHITRYGFDYFYYENGIPLQNTTRPIIIRRYQSGKIKNYEFSRNIHHLNNEDCLNPYNTRGVRSVYFYENGNVSTKYYGDRHNILVATRMNPIPWLIEYHENGKIKVVYYNFLKHEEVPWTYTSISFYRSGKIKSLEYRINNVSYNNMSTGKCIPSFRSYYENGNIKAEIYKYKNTVHRNTKYGPAQIKYYPNGIIKSECYRINGKYRKTDMSEPIEITYHSSGIISSKTYFYPLMQVTQTIFYDKKGKFVRYQY